MNIRANFWISEQAFGSYIKDFVTRRCTPLANEIAAHLSNDRIVGRRRESHIVRTITNNGHGQYYDY